MTWHYYLVHIQFLGFRFHGWAKQPEVKTVHHMIKMAPIDPFRSQRSSGILFVKVRSILVHKIIIPIFRFGPIFMSTTHPFFEIVPLIMAYEGS